MRKLNRLRVLTIKKKAVLRLAPLRSNVLPSFILTSKKAGLLREISFKNRSRRTKLRTFPRDFKRLWGAMQPYRIGFKPFDFYYPFLSLLPYPFPTYDTYFRLQTRTFIFWYEFAARKYNITFDFGINQKKTASETAVWLRTTRRGAPPVYSWWTHWRRTPSFGSAIGSKFLTLNSNGRQPFFFTEKPANLLWLEESLPQARRQAWNFYSRLSTLRSGFFSLSQSIFDKRSLSRRAPSDSTTFWLASPVHDYSAFVKSYSVNKSMVLPERFFQFRREREYLAQYWSQSFSRLWYNFQQPSSLALNFIFPNLLFYSKTRITLLFFSSLFFTKPMVLSFWQLFSKKLLTKGFSRGAETGRTANTHWYSRMLPVPSRKNKFKMRFRTISFFVRSAFFLRHLRRRLFKRPQTLSFSLSLSHRVHRLNFLLPLLFQLYSFNSHVQYHQLFYLFFSILHQEWFASNLAGRYLTLRPNHRFHQRPKKKWKPRPRSLAQAVALLNVRPPQKRKGSRHWRQRKLV